MSQHETILWFDAVPVHSGDMILGSLVDLARRSRRETRVAGLA
jgi:uncharacterized protein (DUF111 family)